MPLILNLPGAIQSLRKAQSDNEKLNAINDVTKEFYRALGIILYTRYCSIQSEKLASLHRDVVTCVRDNLRAPSFESWVQLGRICGDHLTAMGDRLNGDYKEISEKALESSYADIVRHASKILDGGDNHDSEPPSVITYPHALRLLRRILDLSRAKVFSGSTLRKLLESSFDDLIPAIIEELMSCFDVEVLVPVSFGKRGVETQIHHAGTVRTEYLPAASRKTRFIYDCYLRFYKDEDPFDYHAPLLFHNKSDDACYCYDHFLEGKAFFGCLNLDGSVSTTFRIFDSFEDLFDIPPRVSSQYDLFLTFEQRFGRTEVTNGVIHNLQERSPIYVRRPKVELELRSKIGRKKFYITTLDGGGGYGKTELARAVVWDFIDSSKESLPKYLHFDYVVWVTGKIEFFHQGKLESRAQSLGSVEDLMDSILYVTGNYGSISRPSEVKNKLVIEALNESKSTLILLDNLETVTEQERIWQYLVELIDAVKSEIRIVTTSRIRVGSAELVVTVRRMEDDEARQLALSEMDRLAVGPEWKHEKHIASIIEGTGGIPLLIRHFVSLLKRGYQIDEIVEKLSDESDVSLAFMCDLQWDALDAHAQKLLTGISHWGNKLSFDQAMKLCRLSDEVFREAREQLVLHSFLEEQPLVDSVLEILPPIGKFAKMKLMRLPKYEQEFLENETHLRTPEGPIRAPMVDSTKEEAEINRLFQRAERLLRQRARYEAYDLLKQATDRFPGSPRAWSKRAEFEYRELDDTSEGYTSYRTATLHDPLNPALHEDWAYWEYDCGTRRGHVANLKNSKRLYEQALEYTDEESERKRISLSIARSTLQIGIVIHDQAERAETKKKVKLRYERDSSLRNCIDLLERNLYENPKTREEVFHNSYSYSMLSRAYLLIGDSTDTDHFDLDDCAILCMVKGLKLDSTNQHLLGMLRNNRLLSALKEHGKNVNVNDRPRQLADAILSLDSAVRGFCEKARLSMKSNSQS